MVSYASRIDELSWGRRTFDMMPVKCQSHLLYPSSAEQQQTQQPQQQQAVPQNNSSSDMSELLQKQLNMFSEKISDKLLEKYKVCRNLHMYCSIFLGMIVLFLCILLFHVNSRLSATRQLVYLLAAKSDLYPYLQNFQI